MLEFFRDEKEAEGEGREASNTGRKRKETRHDRARASATGKRGKEAEEKYSAIV